MTGETLDQLSPAERTLLVDVPLTEQLQRLDRARELGLLDDRPSGLVDGYDNGRIPGAPRRSIAENIGRAYANAFDRDFTRPILNVAGNIETSIKGLTKEKVARYGWNYLTSQSPHHIFTESWRYRGAALSGILLRSALLSTGIGAIPVWGGSIKIGISAGGSFLFYNLGELDIRTYVKKIEKDTTIDEIAKQKKIEEFTKYKKKSVSEVNRGLAWGLGIGGLGADLLWENGGSEVASNAWKQAQMVKEGAEQTDWTQVANNISKDLPNAGAGVQASLANPTFEQRVASITKLISHEQASADTSLVHATEPATVAVVAEVQPIPGITTIDFPTVDKDGNDRPSLRGLVKAKLIGSDYGIGEIKPDSEGVTIFDPKNGNQVEAGLLELENDLDAQDKIKARMNFFIHQNAQRMGAFSVDPITKVVNGETLARTYIDQNGVAQLTKYVDLTPKAEKEFYQSGEWKQWVNMPGTQIMDENVTDRNYQWAQPQELSQGDDPIYSNIEAEKLGIQGTYLKPENMKSGIGMSQAIVAEKFYGIKDAASHFDASNSDHMDALQAKLAQDPLHIYREALFDQHLHADSKNAFFKQLDPETGVKTETDLLVALQPDGVPTKLYTYEDPTRMLTTLVNEGPASGAFDGPNPFVRYNISEELFTKTSEVIGIDNVYPIRTLAQSIYSDFDLDEIAGGDEVKKEQILKALILYIKENHSQSYFAGEDLVRFKSPQTGVMVKFRLPKEEILRKIMAKVA